MINYRTLQKILMSKRYPSDKGGMLDDVLLELGCEKSLELYRNVLNSDERRSLHNIILYGVEEWSFNFLSLNSANWVSRLYLVLQKLDKKEVGIFIDWLSGAISMEVHGIRTSYVVGGEVNFFVETNYIDDSRILVRFLTKDVPASEESIVTVYGQAVFSFTLPEDLLPETYQVSVEYTIPSMDNFVAVSHVFDVTIVEGAGS